MESVLLPIGKSVLKLFASPMADKLKSLSEMNNETEINLIQGKLRKIKNMLSVIDGRFEIDRNNEVKKWIEMARNVAYEFADFQDDCKLASVMCETQLLSVPKYVSKLRKSKNIQSIQKLLDDTLDLSRILELEVSKENVRQPQWRKTNAICYDDERMIGRDDVKDQMIEMLKSESVEDKSNYNVIPIEGMGGIGKTTLTQYVYNSDDIREHFELKIWVCVSDNFDVERLTREIINSISIQSKGEVNENGIGSSIDDNWDVLQRKLIELLRGKRFLLVLDDLWNHEEVEKWKDFKKAFIFGQKGSKILVTTRLSMVTKMVNPKIKPIVLRELSNDNFWDVFKMFAFEGSIVNSNLEAIGRHICRKLKGSPLAAKTIGKLLNNELTIAHWKAVSDSELWNASQNDNTDIMPALLLSYQHLPEDLKPCFAFFSLFPKDHIFDGKELIEMWGAHGWIKDEGNRLMEDVGKKYLNELLDRSIIQSYTYKKYPSHYGIQIEKYVMHDLMRDLALFVSNDEYLFVKSESDLHKISSNIIHLSVYPDCDIGRVQKEDFQNLRTFIVRDDGRYHDLYSCPGIDDIIFANAKKLRVFEAPYLYIHDSNIIKNTRYLRYLHVRGISKLPSSFYTLYFLQILITWETPKEINKLVNLRRVKDTLGDGHHISKGVSKMRMLRELSFDVSNEIGETIKELKNLKNLETLSLFHLGRVVSNEDVMECNLMEKRHLHELRLSWGSPSKNVSEYDVFEGLQPPANLRGLQIDNYGGIISPNWMKNLSLLNLQRIVISECRCWNMEDVTFGHLPNLMYLEIMGMSGVQQLGPKFFGDGDVRGFPSLEFLKLSWMDNLEEWRMYSDNLSNTQIFPRLQWLEVYECPKLKNIPFQIPSAMRVINLKSCPNLKFLPSWLQDVTCLEELVIDGICVVESFSCYPNLSVGSMVVLSLQLKYFWVTGASLCQLKEWLMVLSSNTTTTSSELQELRIVDCPELMYFDADMDEALHKLTNLSSLHIWSCPNLVSLPVNGFPSSLQTLCIFNCGKVLKERCKEGGADRHKIEHIPDKIY